MRLYDGADCHSHAAAEWWIAEIKDPFVVESQPSQCIGVGLPRNEHKISLNKSAL